MIIFNFFAGTKRRIKWRFAYSNKPDDVHEIDLMHSLASGKRVRKLNVKFLKN